MEMIFMFRKYFLFGFVFFTFVGYCFSSLDVESSQELRGILKRKNDESGSGKRKRLVFDDAVEVASIIPEEEYEVGGPEVERHYIFEPVAYKDLHKAHGEYKRMHDPQRSFFATKEDLNEEIKRREQIQQTKYEENLCEFEEIIDDLKNFITEMPEEIIDIAETINVKNEKLKMVFNLYSRRFPTKTIHDFHQEKDTQGNQRQCYVDVSVEVEEQLRKYRLQLNKALGDTQNKRVQCLQMLSTYAGAETNNLEIKQLRYLIIQCDHTESRIMERLDVLRAIDAEISNRDFEKRGLYDQLSLHLDLD